jgi:hypothetical protein
MHTEHLARLLSANPFFAGLDPETLREIAALCVTCTLSKNDTLFTKGDPGDALYAIRRGQIRIGVVDEGAPATCDHSTRLPSQGAHLESLSAPHGNRTPRLMVFRKFTAIKRDWSSRRPVSVLAVHSAFQDSSG